VPAAIARAILHQLVRALSVVPEDRLGDLGDISGIIVCHGVSHAR
jgi:hypothetical protein